MGNTTKPRFGAIATGALCALGAAAVLVEDVRHTHTVTLDHLLGSPARDGCAPPG